MDGLTPGGTTVLRTLDPFTVEECIPIGEAAREPVASFYRCYGLADLLERPEFAV